MCRPYQARTPHAELDFAVARTGLDRQEAYMLPSIIGELQVGTIVPEERNGELL